MKDLCGILNFVTSESGSNFDIFQNMLLSQKDNKVFQLISHIQKNPFTDDETAIKKVYGDTPENKKFRMLKSRLKDRFINLMFLADTNFSFDNPYNKSLFQVQRNILAAQVLILNDKRRLAISLLKPALQTAIHYEHTQAAVSACHLLCYHEAYSGNPDAMQDYETIFNKQLQILNVEFEIENLYNRIISQITLSADYDAKTLRLLKNNFAKAQQLFRQQPSHLIRLYYYRIAIKYFHSVNQFKKVTALSREYCNWLESKPHLLQNVRIGEFALHEMESRMRMRQFEAGKECAQRCLRYFRHYGTLWLQFNEYYFLLSIREGNIEHAFEILNFVTASRKFYKLPPIQKERWRIYEAYLNFALPDELPKKQFYLFRFLNKVPLSKHDKPGYNYSILVAQIILLINIHDTNRLIDLEYSFREYLRRYIDKIRHPRHYYFGEMLRMFFKNNYSMTGLEKQAAGYLKKMNTGPYAQSLEETEVIPYEKLWQMLEQKCRMFKKEESASSEWKATGILRKEIMDHVAANEIAQ